MKFLVLLLLASNANAYHVVYMREKPTLADRDITVVTYYDPDPAYFNGFHTKAYESIIDEFGTLRVVDLYFHTAINEGYARIQHGLAVCFVREKHIQGLMKQWEEMKARRGRTPSPSTDEEFIDSRDLYDISENEEEKEE